MFNSRLYLLSQNGNDYKANLHCHTNLSDGGDTPEYVKQYYMNKGYSIVAYTDHNVFIPHPELNDQNFLALNGFEIDITDCEQSDENLIFNKAFLSMRSTHINLIALDEEIEIQPFFHRTKYYFCNACKTKDNVKFDQNEPNFERYYTPKCVNYIFKKGREKGFFVTYNHPVWSLENYSVYSKYEGMNALEIMNGASLISGFNDNNFQAYDDLLRQGKKVFAVAGDDNHGIEQAFVAWTVIRADDLSYNSVAAALKNGNFYASNGPEFKELYVEDGRLFVTSSDVKSIIFSTDIRHASNVHNTDGSAVNKAHFTLWGNEKYVRVTLVGFDGSVAYSNPYFLK